MPWVTIILWVVSYFLSKKKGNSTAESAAIATGVAAATYYVAEPTNPNNLLGIGAADPGTLGSAKTVPGSPAESTAATASQVASAVNSTAGLAGAASSPSIAGLAGTAIQTAGSTLSSWGGAGTSAVIGTAAIASSSGGVSGFIDKNKWLLLGGAAILVLMK